MTRKRSLVAAYALISIAFALAANGCRGSQAESENKNSSSAQATPTPIDVTTAAAIERALPRYIEATATLAADEQTDVAPNVAGRVVAVAVDLGSYVSRGAVLVRLDDQDARLRLEQAEAQLQQARASVRQAEERIGLRPGQQFDPARVPEVQAARAALDLAEKQLRRYERLVESGDVSRAAYDQQRAQRDQLRDQYEAALAQARQSYAAVQTARAAAEAAAAQVEQARKAIRDAVVYAPISGYVADRPADIGEYVTPSSKIATIVRTNPMRVRIEIPEQSLGAVRTGQSVSVSVSSYPGRNFSGRIVRLSPNLNAASRTLIVEAEIENNEGLLKPGQFATVRILLPESQPAVLIPQRAVRAEAGINRVFVIKNGHAEERVVQLGQIDGDLVEIKNGVAAGELVATSNLDKLRDGVPVRQ
ncbi:efflux RND transporter periplasmic adaptor subunit [Pyrinomonas methylaliphatogenes]|uniref:RND family efflux transporter, MFP subunit n=1 Tax=Pyrinomonas methylaliphatogenes TaxID=454194 RepID=A0A0B6WX99_9BACT|nr:efflux RND transporter periplasmic adaptor subunit [Pyrinomonas methylaliphatogenes]CDM65686.1 RND family efflux transporter, MFP subunit [Pyrinomonas methylaliphatogenes]